MVVLTISVEVSSTKQSELLSAFQLFVDITSRESGCTDCRLLRDVDNENHLELEEKWTGRAELDAHFRTDTFSALLGAVKLLGENHEIRINDGEHIEGEAAVDAARSETE